MVVTVLLSGGLDSAVLLALLRSRGVRTQALHLRYGQPSGPAEERAAIAIADRLGVPITVQDLPPLVSRTSGEILGRNALFAFLALACASEAVAGVALGLHAGCTYYDTSPSFAEGLTRLLDGYTGGAITLITPFLDRTKDEIVELGLALGVPLELTWSCERGSVNPCGQCLSCLDREALHV